MPAVSLDDIEMDSALVQAGIADKNHPLTGQDYTINLESIKEALKNTGWSVLAENGTLKDSYYYGGYTYLNFTGGEGTGLAGNGEEFYPETSTKVSALYTSVREVIKT